VSLYFLYQRNPSSTIINRGNTVSIHPTVSSMTICHGPCTTDRLPTAAYQRPFTNDRVPPTTYQRQRTTDYLPTTAYHRLLTNDSVPPTTYQRQRTTDYLPTTAYHRLLTTDHLPLTVYLLAPAASALTALTAFQRTPDATKSVEDDKSADSDPIRKGGPMVALRVQILINTDPCFPPCPASGTKYGTAEGID